jgi:hypothetical protein
LYSILHFDFLHPGEQTHLPFGTPEETFFYKPTFSAFRNRNNSIDPSCGWFHPSTITISIAKEKIMKKLKVMLLMAVIALGLAGAATAAQAGCCASDDCCTSCSGSC